MVQRGNVARVMRCGDRPMAMDEAPLVREEARHLIKLGAKAAQERPDLVQSILQAWPGNEPLQQLRRQMAILLLFIKEGPAGPHTAPGGTLGMALQEIAYDAYFEFKNKLPPGTGVLRQLADAESNRDPGYLQYGKDSTVKRSEGYMRLRLNLLLKDHPLQPLPAATATVGLARAPSSKASFTSLDTIPDTQPPPQPPVPSPAPSPNPPRAPLIIGNLPLPVPPATQPPTDPTEPSEPSDAPDARSEGSAPNLDWRTFGLGALVQRALDPDPRVRAAAANAYPGDDPRSTVKRWAVRLLAGVGGGPSGAHSLEAGPLGNGLRQLAAGDYEALKKGSGGLMRQLDETGEAGRGGRCLLKYYKEAGEGYLKLNLAALLRDLPAGAPPVEPAGSVHAAAAAAAARSANRNRNARANGNAANSAAGAAAPSGPATSAPTQAQAQAPNPAAGTAAAAPTTSDADADPDPIVEYDVVYGNDDGSMLVYHEGTQQYASPEEVYGADSLELVECQAGDGQVYTCVAVRESHRRKRSEWVLLQHQKRVQQQHAPLIGALNNVVGPPANAKAKEADPAAAATPAALPDPVPAAPAAVPATAAAAAAAPPAPTPAAPAAAAPASTPAVPALFAGVMPGLAFAAAAASAAAAAPTYTAAAPTPPPGPAVTPLPPQQPQEDEEGDTEDVDSLLQLLCV